MVVTRCPGVLKATISKTGPSSPLIPYSTQAATTYKRPHPCSSPTWCEPLSHLSPPNLLWISALRLGVSLRHFENITKWGAPNCIVTNNYPRDFRKSKLKFDLILCDVPCSGEGMMRKDPGAISEWSLKNVEKCWQLQREIVADAWECLNPGGLFIYSTCTFNTKENEENIQWMLENFDAEVLDIPVDPSWQITGSLLEGFNAPVYRFIPGITRGEGLFVCALRKNTRKDEGGRTKEISSADIIKNKNLKVLDPGILLPPSSLLTPKVDVDYPEAIRYLRGEAMVLPTDTPKGIVEITYKGQPIGPVKNIGNRANNLYPKPWRIKSTHLPSEAPKVLGNVKM